MGFIFDALNKSSDGARDAKQPLDVNTPSELPPPNLGVTAADEDAVQPLAFPGTDSRSMSASASASELASPAFRSTATASDDDGADPIPFNPTAQPVVSTAQANQAALRAAREADPSTRARGLQPTNEPIDVRSLPRNTIDERLVGINDVTSLPCEEYRAIRTSLLAKWSQKRHLVHTITSATPQEGKTITSLNLGMAFAELRNRRTIVIEADLRLPSFGKLTGQRGGQGLTDVLRGKATLEDSIQRFDSSHVHFLTAGTRTPHEAVHLLSSQAMADTIGKLRNAYDHVIIDTPPVVEMADAGILGAMSDDVLLIVRMNITPRSLVEQAVRVLNSYNAPVAGMIATDVHRAKRKFYYYRYGYRYGYRYHERVQAQRQAA